MQLCITSTLRRPSLEFPGLARYNMEYELFLLINSLGAVVVLLILGYHFLGLEEGKKKTVK